MVTAVVAVLEVLGLGSGGVSLFLVEVVLVVGCVGVVAGEGRFADGGWVAVFEVGVLSGGHEVVGSSDEGLGGEGSCGELGVGVASDGGAWDLGREGSVKVVGWVLFVWVSVL